MPSQVVLADFGSATVNTKVPAYKLSANEWQALENVIVRNGVLEPLGNFGPAITTGLPAGVTYRSIYRLGSYWIGSTSRRWIVNWQDTYAVYVTEGSAPPQISNGTTTVSLGPARPTTAPTASAGAAGILNGAKSYVVTFYDAFGQESGPSPVVTSASLTNKQCDLASIPTGGTGIVGRKIYRAVSGAYLKVTTITDNVTTTYTDNADDTTLNDPLLTSGGNPAPNLQGLATGPHIARVWGWVNNALYYSNTGTPWAWSLSSITIPENVVAAAPSPQGLLVLTAARPYMILGSSDASFALKNTNNTFGCAAAFSLVQTDRGLVWWSPSGLVLYDGTGFDLLTNDYLTPAQVASYSTDTMIGAFSAGYYYLFHSGGALIFDLRQPRPTMQTTTQTIDAAFVDKDGTFYIAKADAVKPWGTGSALTMRVRTAQLGGEDQYGRNPIRRAAVFTSGSVTPQWYQDGNAWGIYSPVSPNNGYALCWATRGLMQNADLQVSASTTVKQIEINPE